MSTPLHILVVDDRPDSVLILTEFLLSRGHRVATAGNGQEALDAVIQRQRSREVYDLVISDVTMPTMDGLTLLRELRRRQVTVPVVLYTGYGAMNPNLNQQAVQAGVMALLDKPIELRRVESLLEEVTARRSGTGRRQSSADQPFFGTARVARPTSTRVERRETDAAPQNPATGALERRRSEAGFSGDAQIPQTPELPPLMMPVPSPLPFPADVTPLPQSLNPPPQPIRTPLPSYAAGPRDGALIPPPPIRTPLPFAMPPSQQPASGQPVSYQPPGVQAGAFRTPLPGAPRTGGFHRPASMRTPLPFLIQPPVPPTDVVPPPPPVPFRTPAPGQPAANDPGDNVGQYPTTSFLRRTVDPPVKRTGYVRRPSGLFLSQPDQPTTSRIRRGVTGSHLPPPSTRFGSSRPPALAGSSRAVACAHCRKVFMVATKRESYTVVCVHCGQLNRIDPL